MRIRRLVFVERQVRSYRHRFLQDLVRRLGEHDIDVLAVDEQRSSTEQYWDRSEIPGVDLVSVPTRTRVVRGHQLVTMGVREVLRPDDLVVMPQQIKQLSLYPLLARQWVGGPPIALWGHGESPLGIHHPVTDRAKQLLSIAPHWWFAYTEEAAQVVEGFGYPRERITVALNSTDTASLRGHLDAVTTDDVAAFRAEFGIGDAPTVAFLGSLRVDKRLPFLFDAMREVRARVPDAQLLLVGTGPHEPVLRSAVGQDAWIHFAGPRLGRDAAIVLRSIDVLAVPSSVGLVVVDGITAGVPLVTSASFRHGPEVDYVEHERNGLVVEDGGDARGYGAALAELLGSPDHLDRLRAGCLAVADRYSAEAMAASFTEGVLGAAAAERRGRAR